MHLGQVHSDGLSSEDCICYRRFSTPTPQNTLLAMSAGFGHSCSVVVFSVKLLAFERAQPHHTLASRCGILITCERRCGILITCDTSNTLWYVSSARCVIQQCYCQHCQEYLKISNQSLGITRKRIPSVVWGECLRTLGTNPRIFSFGKFFLCNATRANQYLDNDINANPFGCPHSQEYDMHFHSNI